METQSFLALISLLEQEEAIYGEMATLLDEEREALLAMALDRLGELTSRKETLALRIKAMDESRKLLARRLGTFFCLEPDQVTLSALGRHAPAHLAAPLQAAGEKLRATVERCQAINEYNARAASRGMSLVASSIEYLIAQADPVGKLYQAPVRGARAGGYGASLRRASGSGFIQRQA